MSPSPTIVQKYGGSSLADGASLQRVARHIVARKKQGVRLVVVVSAMGSTTDTLLQQAHALVTHPPQRELDMLVTAGERISMALLCMALHAEGQSASSLTGSQSGIITENAHQGARIVAIRPQRICAVLDRGEIAVVAGYQGVSLEREITTLGRGGSDTTAVALGAALGAEAVEIFSDVDGVYSADPRVCPQARHLAHMSYTFMGDMAHFGAQVLHDQAVAFAHNAGIALWAKDARAPEGRGTYLGPDVAMPEGTLAVSVLRQALLIEAPSPRALWAAGLTFRAAGLHTVAQGGAQALFAWQAVPRDGGDPPGVLQSVAGPLGALCRCTQVSAVTLVGQACRGEPVVLEAHAALDDAGIAIEAVFVGSRSFTAAVPRDSAARAVALLHALIPT